MLYGVLRNVCYADICALVSVRYAGRAGWLDGGQTGSNGSKGNTGRNQGKGMKNGAKRAENRGVVDILYEGFRKCFVNCKFTFYITLSSYYKKVKISKTRKNHSKM